MGILPQSIDRRRAGAGIALIVLAALLGAGALSRFPRQSSGTIWKGYRCLLVEASVGEGKVLEALTKAGLNEVLSPSTEPVQISDWSGIEVMSLAQAESRLIKGDPRLDDYLARLGLWFSATVKGEAYDVYYVKEQSSIAFEAKLARALEGVGGSYILADGVGGKAEAPLLWPGLIVTAMLAALSLWASLAGKGELSREALLRHRGSLARDQLCLRLLLCLPWMILSWASFDAAALALIWGMAAIEAAEALDTPIDEYRRAGSFRAAFVSLRGQALPAFGLAVTGLLGLIFVGQSLIPVALCVTASMFSALGWTVARAGTDTEGNRRFTPLPIYRPSPFRRSLRRRLRGPMSALACLAILAWGLGRMLFPVSSFASSPEVPAPFATAGSARPLVAESRTRAKAAERGGPPGIASWLEHLALQEALPYVRLEEERPDPFTPALMPSRAGEPGLRFDDEWARASYRSIPELSVEGMLLAQGGAVVARVPSEGSRRGRPLAPIGGLLYIILMVPPIGRTILGIPNARAAASGEIRQEA